MKKTFPFLAASLLFCCISCSDEKTAGETKTSSATQKNLEASRVITKAFESGDPSKIDSVVSSDFVDHTDMGDWNRDSMKSMISMIHTEFPDMKMEVIKELADDDHVFTWMRFTGTSKGQMGMPAGPYDFHEIQVVKFKDGKAVEHWGYMERREMMKMMPKPEPTNGTGNVK